MKIDIIDNSIVIVAASHNPTILSDSFLIKSGMISKSDEIDLSNLIITPAFSQVIFKNKSGLNLDNDRLIIRSTHGVDPFEKAQKYCAALPHIKCIALGINFVVSISEFDFKNWFDAYKKINEFECSKVTFSKSLDNNLCTIIVTKEEDNKSRVDFNFHYAINDKTIGELQLDFLSEWKKNSEFINVTSFELFK